MGHTEEILHSMVKDVPGVVAAVLIDTDGIPLALAGEFDLELYDLGAMLAACQQCYQVLAEDLGQFCIESIIAEFDDLKLVQQRMPRGCLVVVADKSTPLGVIRMQAKRGLEEITRAMRDTAEARGTLILAHKFRKQQTPETGYTEPLNLISFLEEKG